MAERHDVQHILKVARELVHKVQSLMDNKWPQMRRRRRRREKRMMPKLSVEEMSACSQLSVSPEKVQRCGVDGLLGSFQVRWRSEVVQNCCCWGGPAAGTGLDLFTFTFTFGMLIVSVQTCGRVCMLVSLITLWGHSSVSPSPAELMCVCAWKHNTRTHMNTHTHTLNQVQAPVSTSKCWKRTCAMPVGIPLFLHQRPVEFRIPPLHCQRNRGLCHEVFISDQMYCANYLFHECFLQLVCVPPPPRPHPAPFFLSIHNFIFTQMLPLSVTAQGT